jgi:hypothetical protein
MKEKLSSSISFDIKGNNIVKSIKYEDSKIYINTTQFFNGIPEKTWNFNIGAYQVLDKWLKSRKKRELSSQEIEQFIQIIEIINRTIILMERLDNIPFSMHQSSVNKNSSFIRLNVFNKKETINNFITAR